MDLMRLLPWRVYHDQEHVADFQRAWGQELDVLIAARDDYYTQLRPGTATWGLALFEREYGIVPDPSKAMEQRLRNWRAKRRGRGTTTTPVLKQTTELVTGLPAQVIEFPELDYFQIEIDSGGKPMDLLDLVKVIEEIKPAHLGMVFLWRVSVDQKINAATLGGSQTTRRHAITPPEKTTASQPAQILPHSYSLRGGTYAPTPPPKQIQQGAVRHVFAMWTQTHHTAVKGATNYG